MTLRDGFYLYIISTVWNGIKIQTIKMYFDCRCNVVRIPLFDEDGFSLLCLDHQNYSILERSEEELMLHLDSFRNSFCSCGEIDSQKKELVLIEDAYLDSPVYRPLFNTSFFDGELCDCIQNNLCEKRLYKDAPINAYSNYLDCINQYEILEADLEQIFKTVAPNRRNFKVFGHSLRNLLILACTEVDCLLKDIYISIKGCKESNFYSTKDYVSLLPLLHLKEYEILFRHYPSLGGFNPFLLWNEDKPTNSILWYDAYNAVKHDRGQAFDQATLENCLCAVAAVGIILAAKYGYRNEMWNETLGKKICFSCEPKWSIFDFRIHQDRTRKCLLCID